MIQQLTYQERITIILISENSNFPRKKTTRKLPDFNKNLLNFILILSKNLLVNSWFCKLGFGNPGQKLETILKRLNIEEEIINGNRYMKLKTI